MKKGSALAAVLCVGCILTGCSGFSPEVTGVSIDKKGGITSVVRENFAEDYYSEEELKAQVDSAVEAYNTAAGDKFVKKRGLKIKDGVAELSMTYASYKDYADFNNIGFYVGDINGAIQAGYAFDGSFLRVTDGKVDEGDPVWGSSIMSGTNYQTVVIKEPLLVEVPGTIRYVSENVKVKEKSVAVAEEAATAYILYE